MSNGKKKKPKYHQIPDDLPASNKTRKQRNAERDPTERMRDDIRGSRRAKVHYATNPTAKRIVKAVKTVDNALDKGTKVIYGAVGKANKSIVDKRRKARDKRERDARAQDEADYLRRVKADKKKK